MKGFKIDRDGDVVIEHGVIPMVSDALLTAQKVQTVLGTNQGEWFLNKDEGINFRNILVKNPDYDAIRDEVNNGLFQVDSSFNLDTFEHELEDRTLHVEFTASNGTGQKITVEQNYT